MNPSVPEALAHCLATEAKSRPLEVDGLGTFHVRLYGEGARHRAGVLFLAARELRVFLAGGSPDGPAPDAGEEEVEDDAQELLRAASKTPLSFAEWLARTSQKGPEWAAAQLAELSKAVRKALASGEPLDLPALGTFTAKLMAEMTVTASDTGASRTSPRRIAACFTPSDALRRRLAR